MKIIPETRMFASVFAVSDICRRIALMSISQPFPAPFHVHDRTG